MDAETTLVIKHLPGETGDCFQLARQKDGKSVPPVTLTPPAGFPVQGRPDSDLLAELRWYLETFLDYPSMVDQRAQGPFASVAAALLRAGMRAVVAMREALAASFGPAAGPPPSEGEVARQALLLLAQDPQAAAALQALLDGPSPERFLGPVETGALITAVLVVLQTHVRIERTPGGKLKWLVEKKPTAPALLGPLVSKLLALLQVAKP